MRPSLAALALIAAAGPALAENGDAWPGERAGSELEAYVQCAPYAREVSGIQIYGDARSWWDQAQGRYATGSSPRVGAVMAFRPNRSIELGHVAAVSRVIDFRRVLLDHANWSPVGGRRGRIEKDVLAIDVSSANDWSEVRVWYAPLGNIGSTVWPVEGFIYPDSHAVAATRVAQAPARRDSSKRFLSAFAEFAE